MKLKWKKPGYHYIVLPNGAVRNLLPIEEVSNGVAGFNSQIINISYIGGVSANGDPVDNRTPFQKESMWKLLKELKRKFPTAVIQGHRDFPGVHKACPSFNAKIEYALI
jgi:N-acetylmuramoyl-L-alanine amidase